MRQLYEVNVRSWLAARSRQLGRPATLDDVSYDFLDRLAEHGFTWLYLLGVWPTGPLSRAATHQDQQLRQYLQAVIPDIRDEDLTGSPMAPACYKVSESFGGDAALERLRDRARTCGLSLMLDFVPNHVGLDHPWLAEHPDWFVRGGDDDARRDPSGWVRLHGQVFAHGKDPFFPPWPATVQLDYGNPAVHEAMVGIADSIAARCDGLRCDVAMLQLPDVFERTWGRPMPQFWRGCLDRVRAHHPGTLFMAEVYWNREYELQVAGFDLTYDKILYDRLLAGEAEAIRAHLRANLEYQKHCVRFLENHEEQRAAARFPYADHHRGALFLTGMVPGLLLCHHGQEEGLTLHGPLQASCRPPEPGSPPHARAYQELMQLLSEPARHDGSWQLLEPRQDGRTLIGCLWSLPAHHSLLVAVNASWEPVRGHLDAGPFAGRDCQVQDALSGGSRTIEGAVLRDQGFAFELPSWGAAAWRVLPTR